MKNLHVLSAKGWGGGTASLKNPFAEMSILAPKVTNTLFCIKNKDLQHILQKADYKVTMGPSTINTDQKFIFLLIQICRSEEIDLLHLHVPIAIITPFTERAPSLQKKKSVGKSILPLQDSFRLPGFIAAF